jgi:hypothetical protein
MIGGAATWAIAGTRLSKERRVAVLVCAACALLAYVQRYDDAAARLAGCLVFGTLSGIAVALLQRASGRLREIELCEISAPLFGRELARATALVPCTIVIAGIAAYWGVAAFYVHVPPFAPVTAAAGVCAATITALCAAVTRGLARLAYIALACTVAASAFVLWLAAGAGAPPVFCACWIFIALRQYGEALARYEPIAFG